MRPLALAFALGAALAATVGTDAQTRVAQTIEVRNADAAVYLAPRADAPRRGTLALGARFPFRARVAGEGCPTEWFAIDDAAWVCGHHVEVVRAAPERPIVPTVAEGHHLPYDYAFVAFDGTRTFTHPRDAFTDDYYAALGEGFGIVVTGFERHGGTRWARTLRGLYVDADSLRMARGSDFVGVPLEGTMDVAWVRRGGATLHDRRGGRVVRRAGHREVVRTRRSERGWTELTDGSWVRTRSLHAWRPTAPPDGVPAGGTWIDIDVREQVLVFSRGDRALYATLVSTGRAGRTATPSGLHRTWVKLAYSDMDDLERVDAEHNYAIERVPWVQYFEGSNGLHAAFWHDDFGRRRSHGCVNLAPRDARVLYELSEPAVPAGWTAIFPREDEPTTYVNVRD
ncbi:MAG: L,D-transpeptidase [Sandaracinus sp.]|nr:L,D-transpeptidase [Sandaracinus sp.]MCB9616505.1 L,D-transpeptidase [Sandaracinus sp.]